MDQPQAVARFPYDSRLELVIGEIPESDLAVAIKILKLMLPGYSFAELKAAIAGSVRIEIYDGITTTVEQLLERLTHLLCQLRSLSAAGVRFELYRGGSQCLVSLEELDWTVNYHANNLFRFSSPEIDALLCDLIGSNWVAHVGVPISTEAVIQRSLPYKDCDAWQRALLILVNEVRDKLDNTLGCHPTCLNFLYRQVGTRIDDVVLQKLASLQIPGDDGMSKRVCSLIKLTCAQMFYNVENVKKTEAWCRWLVRGRVPVGWEGEFPDGRLCIL